MIVSPTSVTLEEGEAWVFLNDTDPGTFWSEFKLDRSGTKFTRVQRPTRLRPGASK